jgi:hypothetical protein
MSYSDSLDNITLDSDDILTIERFENNYYNHKNNVLQIGGNIIEEKFKEMLKNIILKILKTPEAREALHETIREVHEAQQKLAPTPEFHLLNPTTWFKDIKFFGGGNKKKLKKNIIRLYNCYILSQNQNGGTNNKLSLTIKKRLDKKITELKNLEGGESQKILLLKNDVQTDHEISDNFLKAILKILNNHITEINKLFNLDIVINMLKIEDNSILIYIKSYLDKLPDIRLIILEAIIKLFFLDEILITSIAKILRQDNNTQLEKNTGIIIIPDDKIRSEKNMPDNKIQSKNTSEKNIPDDYTQLEKNTEEKINKIIEIFKKKITEEKDYYKIIYTIIIDIFSKFKFPDFKFSDLDFFKLLKIESKNESTKSKESKDKSIESKLVESKTFYV